MHRLELVRTLKANGDVDDETRAALEAEVRETYLRHDRELSNPESRRLFEQHVPDLDSAQQDVLERLRLEGYAAVPFASLFEPDRWATLSADSAAFQARVESDLAAGGKKAKPGKPGKAPKAGKPGKAPKPGKVAKKKFILHRQFAAGSELSLDNPWFALGTSPRILQIVNSYLGLWAKLSYVDEWYTVPGGSDAERLGSQRWHRDYNDQHLIKVFLYMTDVDEGSGPFEYVPGSARGGPYENEWPWEPLGGDTYPDQADFAQRIPESATRTFTAAAGTMIFCNTSGFHRGGFATERRRVLGVFNYVSPAALESLVERNYSFDPETLPSSVAPEIRFALT